MYSIYFIAICNAFLGTHFSSSETLGSALYSHSRVEQVWTGTGKVAGLAHGYAKIIFLLYQVFAALHLPIANILNSTSILGL